MILSEPYRNVGLELVRVTEDAALSRQPLDWLGQLPGRPHGGRSCHV